MKMHNKPLLMGFRKTSILWVLALSLIANCFCIGIFVGCLPPMFLHKHFALLALGMPHSEQMIKHMSRALNPEEAASFHTIIDPQAEALKQSHDHVRQSIKAIVTLYGQDQTDPAAMQAAIEDLKKAHAALNALVMQIIQDSYVQLSPEARRLLAKAGE